MTNKELNEIKFALSMWHPTTDRDGSKKELMKRMYQEIIELRKAIANLKGDVS